MKKLNLNIIVLSSIFLFFLSSCWNEKSKESSESTGQQEISTQKGERKIIFENDYAVVVKVKLAPGEFISPPGGEGKDRVIYSLADYSLDWKKSDGQKAIKSWKKGDIHFHKAGKHYVNNVGNTTAEWLVFVKNRDTMPEYGENTLEKDVNSVSPDFAQTLFENDDFKLTQVNLPKGENIPTHSGINRIVYSLSDYALKYESDAKGKIEKQFTAGDVHWHKAGRHALENDGETEARYLVVSYKQKDK